MHNPATIMPTERTERLFVHADVDITYRSSRGSDLDTRLLRANVIKGILEEITTANVNMVNADLLAEQRGLRITETISKTDSKAVVSEMNVKIGTSQAKFSGAVVGDKINVSVRSFLLAFFCSILFSHQAMIYIPVATVCRRKMFGVTVVIFMHL